MSQIIIKNLSVKRGENLILKDLNLTIPKGEFVAVVGKSGIGKTTLLNALAGFLPSSGDITMSNNIGMVFQQDSVFPWLSVEDNIAFGLDKFDQVERAKITEEHLCLTELKEKRKCYPMELSGGQIQRVAIARSLAPDPEILLMDEPYSALDAYTREKMQEWLLNIWNKKQKTVIFVTHNIEEAIFLADRVLILKEQKINHEILVPFSRPRDKEIRFTEKFNGLKKEILFFVD